MGRRWVPRPRQRRRKNTRQRPRSSKNTKSARNGSHMTSIKIITQPTKGSHNKEEVYPIELKDLISRRNVGQDADINVVGYTISIALATGNDVSTVTSNIGHSGPWVRRGISTDNFDQQFPEHTFRGKSVLFRKKVVRESEREYVNPDTDQNFINVRIRDPCGVIPGVMMKIEARFHLIRRMPSSEFAGATEKAVDAYEDQDVSTGPQPGPTPPGPVAYDIPKLIRSRGLDYTTTSTTSPYNYINSKFPQSPTIIEITQKPVKIVGQFEIVGDQLPQVQRDYAAAGYSGTITQISATDEKPAPSSWLFA